MKSIKRRMLPWARKTRINALKISNWSGCVDNKGTFFVILSKQNSNTIQWYQHIVLALPCTKHLSITSLCMCCTQTGDRKVCFNIHKFNFSLKTFLSDLRMVQPGRLVASAHKYAWRKRRIGADQSGNLGQVASVITGRRVYNLEFTDYSDLKSFYNMIEAVFGVTLLTS